VGSESGRSLKSLYVPALGSYSPRQFHLHILGKCACVAYQLSDALLEFLHVDIVAFSLSLISLLLDLGRPRTAGDPWRNHFSA
jgi:hypothetical protein